MKKKFLLFGLLISFCQLNACDICGCGVNNFYIGILPRFNHKFLGLRYHFNSFNTRLTNDPSQYSKDFYQAIELWGGWNVGKKFQFLAFVPVNHNYQNSDDGIAKLTGLGDATVLANYKLLDESSVGSQGSLFSQQLWVGGGVKLNTGKFDIENGAADIAAAANRQLGSGSIDLLLNAIYNVQIDKFGISTTASYKINSANKYQYRFGDKLSASSFVYYPISVPNVLISPNLGILYEKTQPSELQNSKIDLTAGTILEGSVGLEISFNKTTFGFSAQLPLAQNFAENQTHSRVKGMAHMSFAF